MTKDILALDSLIRKFKDKFLFGEVKHWAYQYKHSKAKDVAYIPFECKKCPKEIRYSCEHRVPLSLNDLYNHFCQEPVSVWFNSEDDKFDKAGIALRPVFENKQVRWFVVDSDNEESTNVLLQRFIPVLRNYNIDYIYEHGSTYYKCHIWFMVNCHVDTLNDFTRQLFEEADIDFKGKDRSLELEIYPLVKPNALIRIPGGFHLRNKTANPIEYGGITSSDPEFIIKTFIRARVLSEEEIKTLTKPLNIKSKSKPSDYRNREDFSFFSLSLPTHDENFPEPLRKVMSNCQAFNKVIELSKQKFSPQGGYLNTPGNEHHLAGLYLSGICTYLDIREQKKGNSSNECTKWLNDFLLRVRNRDFSSHNWRRLSENSDSPGKLFPRCEVMDRDLNMCKGCPFADKVTSASEFYKGTEITKEKISSINLLPAEVIRKTTFETVLDRMLTYSEYGIEKDILLASPLGSGKSFAADRIACKLADENRQVLIAVPTARLAIEHRNRIEKMGHKAFILMSHENMFKKDDGIKRFDIDFDCPKKDDIKYLSDLGVSASHYRKQFCGGCKFKESCPYPGQYGKAVEGEHNIVIMQHAHFSCRETLYSLLKKRRFDALIVDEEFIDSLVKRFFISETECEILEKFSLEIPWTERFAKWARGAPVNKDEKAITPNRSELETLRNAFEEKLLPWEVPEYISQYNYHHPYDKNVGFLVFYPLPNIPVRLFLDATPPVNMLKTILNNEALEIFGQSEILDIKTLNKNNEIIQVLNNSTSKTSLEANEWSKFYSLLEYIGDECKAHYKGLQTLITTYMGEHADRAGEFFRRNYPDIFPQLIISHMKIGTNEFENCQVQFQIAGVHLNAKQLAEEAYKFRRIANYWHRMSGRPEIPNPYPYNVKETSELEMFPQDLVRVELLPEPGFYAYPYPLYKSFSPQDPFERQVYELALAKRQQAMRMRFNDGQQKTVVIFDNSFRNSLIITKSIQLESLI